MNRPDMGFLNSWTDSYLDEAGISSRFRLSDQMSAELDTAWIVNEKRWHPCATRYIITGLSLGYASPVMIWSIIYTVWRYQQKLLRGSEKIIFVLAE